MKSELSWSDRVPERDNIKSCVYSLAFRPDGTQLVVAVGNRVLVYDANDGDLIHSLKGHRDVVYSVSYSKDGKRFASGGADKTIIIWTHKCEGILKYCHNDAVQCIAYNPVTAQLASATANDFGLWSPEQKSVQKYKVSAKVICCSWTNEGQYLALGQMNGHISIRDRQGEEKVRIERTAPIWCLSWSPSRTDGVEVLAVGCWDETLSFYQLSGTQLGKDRDLKFDPCSLSYYGDGEYILIGGSDKKVTMWTKEGVYLSTIAEKEDWIWAVQGRPKSKFLACGGNDGTISVYQSLFSTVHGLFQDRYAYRDTMTDVIIQHLITEQKVRIKTRDYVKKIAIYRDRLAVQLPDRVLIYETDHTDDFDMHYKLKEKIIRKMDCNLLVVTSMNVILCQEKKLQLYSFKGKKVREWILEAVIRYIKVIGGPSGREGLLVGLKNGFVVKIFIDNRFPISLIKHKSAIRCLDLSSSKLKLAVVDENSKVFIYDLVTKDVMFEENNATSVAWNSDMEDMLCFSGNNMLSIKTGDFPIHRQKLQGFVVGFKASKIFCLHFISMQTIDVPQSVSMYRYMEKKEFLKAYNVACLGVTDNDWRELAMETLRNMLFEISRKAFIRLRDIRYIELLNRIDLSRRNANVKRISSTMPGQNKPIDATSQDSIYLADILAYQGKYDEAAKIYCKYGQRRSAIEMYLDLRQWEKAKIIVEQFQSQENHVDQPSDGERPLGNDGNISMAELLKRQAQWLFEINDLKAAEEMFWASKDYTTAISILGENNWLDILIQKCRTLPKVEKKALTQAATIFRAANHHAYATEIYLKLDDFTSLMKLHVDLNKWDDAFSLAQQFPDKSADIYAPYAEWLTLNDRFDDAQNAYKLAGKPQDSIKMLLQLTSCATTEHRFQDASYYYWLLSSEHLRFITAASPNNMTEKDREYLAKYRQYLKLADLFYSYHVIYRFVDEPFLFSHPETIFNSAQFILNNLGSSIDTPCISRMHVLLALAKQAQILGAYKLARKAYEKLGQLRLPASIRDSVEFGSLILRSKRFSDPESLLPMCMRCSVPNPLLNNNPTSQGEFCVNCKSEMLRFFDSFDIVPLVEFEIQGLDSHEVDSIIDTDYIRTASVDNDDTHDAGGVQTMSIHETKNVADEEEDEFMTQLMLNTEASVDGTYQRIQVGPDCVRKMKRTEVFIVKPSASLPVKYYRNLIPEVPISMCKSCFHFFHEEDFEQAVLQKKQCPFCRCKIDSL